MADWMTAQTATHPYKVPGQQVYCQTLGDWFRATLWHAVARHSHSGHMTQAEHTTMLKRHIGLARVAQGKVFQWLRQFDTVEGSESIHSLEIAMRCLEVAIRLERQAAGQPDTVFNFSSGASTRSLEASDVLTLKTAHTADHDAPPPKTPTAKVKKKRATGDRFVVYAHDEEPKVVSGMD